MTETRRTSSPRGVAWRWRALLTALLAAALIVGCGQAPPASGNPDPDPNPDPNTNPEHATLRGNVVYPAEEGEAAVPVMGVSLLLLETRPDSVILGQPAPAMLDAMRTGVAGADDATPALTASTVVEVGDGSYLGGLALVDADGDYELVLPNGSDIPEALLVPARDALMLPRPTDDPDCSVVSSNPSARMTVTAWARFVSFPAPVFFTPNGVGLGTTLTEPFDVDDADEGPDGASTFVSVTYATAPTRLSLTGTGCTGDVFLPDVAADVQLVEGWNQVTWTFSQNSLTIGARPIRDEVFSRVFVPSVF